MTDRKLQKWTIFRTAVVCLLPLGAIGWHQWHPGATVVVTIDNVCVAANGLMTVAFFYETRRDSTLVCGWRDADGDTPGTPVLEVPGRRVGFVERWRTNLRQHAAMEFTTPRPESVEPLVETGQRLYLAVGDKLPLMRVDREIDGRTVRQELFLAVRDLSAEPPPDAALMSP